MLGPRDAWLAPHAHPLVPKYYAVDGPDGVDALPYDERNLRQALDALAEAERREQQ
jgi:hypothetical protein